MELPCFFSSPLLPHFLTPILSCDRKTREKLDFFSLSCPMTQHGTSNLWPVTWKCFAFRPYVIVVKRVGQSNLWLDCFYTVLRDSSNKHLLTIDVCSKKTFWRVVVLEKTSAIVFQVVFQLFYWSLAETGQPCLYEFVRWLLCSQYSSQPPFSLTFSPSPRPRPKALGYSTYENQEWQLPHHGTLALPEWPVQGESFPQEGLKGWLGPLQECSLTTAWVRVEGPLGVI